MITHEDFMAFAEFVTNNPEAIKREALRLSAHAIQGAIGPTRISPEAQKALMESWAKQKEEERIDNDEVIL